MNETQDMIPTGLQIWFVIHFIIDVLFAIPLLLFPRLFLTLFGWTTFDPTMTRLVGAALLAIGIESLLGKNSQAETYRAMLNLKVIWASGAIFAIGAGLLAGAAPIAWIFLVIFSVFWVVWVYYRRKLA